MLFHYPMVERAHGLTITESAYHQIIRGEKNKKWLKKGQTVHKVVSTEQLGLQILKEIEDLGLMKVTELGSEAANAKISKNTLCDWKKRSIFWDLSY